MRIECCHHCENRHEKCNAHCEAYNTQKILKILVETQERKKQEVAWGIKDQKYRMIYKAEHDRHLRRKK